MVGRYEIKLSMRAIRLALPLVLLSLSGPVLACECGHAGPACVYARSADVIFVGKVVFTNDDGSGTIQRTLVRFQVEEAFKGLPAGTQTVWIDPGSFTSCYAEYHVGERQLVFAGKEGAMPIDAAMMSVAPQTGANSKPLPPGIDPSNPPVVYSAPECSGTRPITPESETTIAPEIEYLRKFKLGTARPLVTGHVFQDAEFGIFDPPGLPGVKVTIDGKNIQTSTRTDADGRYLFEAVPPGQYILTSKSYAYTASRGSMKVAVSSGGCGWADFDMIGSGVITGQLLDHGGQPAPHVKVNILRFGNDGKPVYDGFKEAESNSQGKYKFEKLPGGDFQVGVNLSSAPDTESPYPATSWSNNGQTLIHLSAGEHKQLSPFSLPLPASAHSIPVTVLWPDGSAAKDVDVWAQVGDDQIGDYNKTDNDGQTHLMLLEGIDYSVEAKIWVGNKPTRKVTRSGITKLTLGSEPISLTLRLTQLSTAYR